MSGQTTGNRDLKTVGQAFSDEMQAGLYRNSLSGGAPYEYPPRRVERAPEAINHRC